MSNLYEYIKMAVHNIMANKGRSFLTMLGIIIGIASVIAIVSVGEGTKNQMNSEIDDIGGGQIAVYCSDEANQDQVWIEPGDIDAGHIHQGEAQAGLVKQEQRIPRRMRRHVLLGSGPTPQHI